MQLTTQLAVEAAQARRKTDDAGATGVDPSRDFLMCVTMNLKTTLDRGDFLNPLDGPRTPGAPISPAEVRAAFVRFAKELRPEFEAKTKFKLILSGEIIGSTPHQFINLWDIATPDDVPKMMEILAMPEDKSQLYGYLDYLVEEEKQEVTRVFPLGLAKVTPPAPGKRLYYVMLPHQPPTVELYRFQVYFSAYPEPLKGAGNFKLITSTISVTGTLNRIVQFWSVEVDQATTVEEVRNLVQKAFAPLPWRSDDDVFKAEAAILLNPSDWDDILLLKAPSVAKPASAPGAGSNGHAPSP
ncbi:MAG: hypothetical protein RL033_5875 [Pseudomonadota bacterium]|jgi:hypothetical protein